MATPTPGRVPLSQQGKTPQLAAATPPVSTPFSVTQTAAFSPHGPRSSPQTLRRSPAPSTMLTGPSSTGGGPMNFDSPSAAAAMGALGIGGALDMGLGVGVIGGLGSNGGEDERLKRYDSVLEIISTRKGMVSEAGLERYVQRIGLDSIWDSQITPDGLKLKTLVIAGKALQIDVVFDNNIVQNVTLSFPESAPIVTRHVDGAAAVLLKDLQLGPYQSPLTLKLDKFAENLDRLANLDKLSTMPGFDLQEALAGLYSSLERLYIWDLDRLKEQSNMTSKSDAFINNAVICTKHGRPVMHGKDKVGLSLVYWLEKRLAPPATEITAEFVRKREEMWSLMISCAPIGGDLLCPAVRISEEWIADKIVSYNELTAEPLLDAEGNNVVEWLNPSPVLLPPSEDDKDGLAQQKHPEVIFKAILDPPVILPHSVWSQIFSLTGLPPPTTFEFPTFDSLFFPVPPGTNYEPSEPRTVTSDKVVNIYLSDDVIKRSTHHNTLFIYKPVYGQILREVPFAHPQQLVAMLPILRQYALISSLLRSSFDNRPTSSSDATDDGHARDGDETVPKQAELEAFTSDTKRERSDKNKLNLDVTLTVHPVPRLQVVFPYHDSTANITLEIRLNGSVHVVTQNVINVEGDESGSGVGLGKGKGKGKARHPSSLGRVLEVMEDLGMWSEWIRVNI